MEAGNIPLIDFDTCGVHVNRVRKDDMLKVGKEIKEAFSTVGFCYLKNHGVEIDELEGYFKASKKFFDLPADKKLPIERGTESNFGWGAMEREHINPERPGDLKEIFNYAPNDDRDDWPCEEFHASSKHMFSVCKELTYRVLDALSVGLGLGESFMRDAHKFMGGIGNSSTLRSLFYPPLPAEIKPGQIRLGEHSDYGSITLLYQDDIGGLEVNIPGELR